MNKYKLFKAGIDVTEGIARLNNNKEIYEKLLNSFPNDSHYKEMCEGINSRDVKAAFQGAHALKGIAGNLSMNKLHSDLVPLVELLRAESLEGAQELLKRVEEDYLAICNAISEGRE